MDMQLLLQLIINGLVIGAIYALIAVGLSLIFGVLEIVNFAHGQLYMLGGFAFLAAVEVLGLSYFPAVTLATIAAAAVGWMLYRGLLSYLRQGEFERGIILTLAIGMVLQNAFITAFGATPRIIDVPGSFDRVESGGVGVDLIRLWAAGLSLVCLCGLWLLLTRTRFGVAMRALAQNRLAATVVGMNPQRVAGHAIVIGIAMTGLAGAALAPVFTVHPLTGVPVLFKAFAIVIIGGLGNVPGAAVAALLVGLTESLAGGLGTSVLQEVAVFVLMIALLQFKPLGLFGRGARI